MEWAVTFAARALVRVAQNIFVAVIVVFLVDVVTRHFFIHRLRPGVDAAVQPLDVFEAALQKVFLEAGAAVPFPVDQHHFAPGVQRGQDLLAVGGADVDGMVEACNVHLPLLADVEPETGAESGVEIGGAARSATC